MKRICICITIAFLCSCASKKEFSIVQGSSIFVKTNALGLTRAEVITKYGNPINRDVLQQGAKPVENLYYLEKIDDVILTTKIRVENNRVIQQSSYKMEYSGEKRIKELELQVLRNRRATLNVN